MATSTPTEVRAATGARASAPSKTGDRLGGFVDRHTRLVFAGPAVVLILLILAFPIAYTIYLSLTQWTGSVTRAPEWVGLDNYVRIFTDDPRFWAAFARTMGFTVLTVAVQTVLGVALAVLLHRELRLRGLLRSVMLMPMIATPVAIALVWRLMFQPDLGIFNQILTAVGLPSSTWLANENLALPLLALVDTWEWTPLIALITLAGLTALPVEPMEAALIDRANAWQRFWHITLPMVRPVIVVALVFRLIDAIKTFDIIFVMTQGGPGFATETLNLYIYNSAFQYQKLGYASALLIVFFALVFVLTGLTLSFRRARD